MKLTEIYQNKKTVLSFEIFPPKKEEELKNIDRTLEALCEVQPDFISVTFGAGGSANKNKTIELAKKINKAVFPGTQGGPLMHVIAGKAVCFGEAMKPEFKEYGKHIVENAQALAKGLVQRGFNLVSGGTDNHLMLVDLRPFSITGKELERRLDEVYITVNKNAIPNDPEKPFVTSGIRVGTPAVTTRGLGVAEMDQIAECMYLTATQFDKADEIREMVTAICKQYPLYE